MPNYKAMYYSLAAQVANAIELLICAQQDGEESVLEETGPVFTLCPTENFKDKDSDKKGKTES